MRTLGKSRAGAMFLAAQVLAACSPVPAIARTASESSVSVPAEPTQKQRPQQDMQRVTRGVRRITDGYSMTRGDYRRAGRGWSNKHVQRMAKKSRNVTRARKANK